MDTSIYHQFVNQFICGPHFVDSLPAWQQVKVTNDTFLTLHPGLSNTQVKEKDRSLTMIGYALDPYRPQADDASILLELLHSFSDIEHLIRASYKLGGRWAIFAVNGEDKYLFNDALGLRQIFYTDVNVTDSLWVISQPGMGESLLHLNVSDAASAFIESYQFRKMPEYRWPSMATAFHELKHMLPNHYLDLNSWHCQRYWPSMSLPQIDRATGLSKMTGLLTGMVKAATHRFDLAMGITAGLDSRTLLATSKDVSNQIDFLTVRQGKMSDSHMDLRVPASLLTKLGLPHRVIKAQPSMTADFSVTYKKNVFMAHDHYGADAEAIYNNIKRQKIVMTGSGAEVGRCSFRENFPLSHRRQVQGHDLARLQGMTNVPFAVDAFNEWLNGIKQHHNINILDLFEWEQGHGNWLAMTQQEMDFAWKDIVAPYNCRELLVTMLSVDEKYRQGQKGELFIDLIQQLWPETLSEPINPDKVNKINMKHRIRKKLRLLKYYTLGNNIDGISRTKIN